jgi:hypothetical protein
VAKNVGDEPEAAYVLAQPTSSLGYCSIIYHYIVNPDGSTWTGASKLNPTGSQPYSSYDLAQISIEDSFSFKFKTQYPGSMTHLSALVTITITCGSSYSISATTISFEQEVTMGEGTAGFTLPTYTSAQQTGCPVNAFVLTSSGTS